MKFGAEKPPTNEKDLHIEIPDIPIEDISSTTTLSERFKGIKRFGIVAAAVGVTLYAGHKRFESTDQDATAGDYIAYELAQEESENINQKVGSFLSQQLDVHEQTEFKAISTEVVGEIGPVAMWSVIIGDVTDQAHQDRLREAPTFSGFESTGFTSEEMRDSLLSESMGVFPKNWIDGEIARVEFSALTAEEIDWENQTVVQGKHFSPPGTDKGVTIIYDVRDVAKFADVSEVELYQFILETFAHELGHANDWSTKSGINVLQRARLLQKTIARMNSEDAYSDKSLNNGEDYWRSFDDNTELGKYRAAKEYWATLCEEYFLRPNELSNSSPDDFALVDEFVKLTDPTFSNDWYQPPE